MCDVIIPALIGVAALGLLGGTGCNDCPTGPVCAVTQVGNETITIPQLAGEGTNVVQVSAQQDFAYQAPQPGPAYYQGAQANFQPVPANFQGAPESYGPYPSAPYGAPQGHYGAMSPAPYQSDMGASVNYDGQSAVGVGGYSNPYGTGLDANVGGLDAGIGVGNGGIGANVGDVGVGIGDRSY